MPPAPDLKKLPPLPVVANQTDTSGVIVALKPIPLSVLEESLGSELEKPSSPKVSQVVGLFAEIANQETSTLSSPAIRKIPSPFVTVAPNPLPAGPHGSSATAKMQPSSISVPARASSSARLKRTITGPVKTRLESGPAAPPETILRNTIRRTIAENEASASPFRDVSFFERLKWMVLALFKSRTFDDIAFEKTRRFRVEEVFLLRKESFTLISYASSDPIRHIYPRKIDYDLRRLRMEVKEAVTAGLKKFKLQAGRQALIREGKHSFLVAVTRGAESDFFEADLDYTHQKIEHQVGGRLCNEVSNFTFPLQPILEDCLLIQSPAAPQ